MFLNPVTENEIINQISTLKNDSAPGLDGISTKLNKLIHKDILLPITHIINLIFKTGQVPNYFKQPVVTPAFKDGTRKNIQNYRLISLIDNFAKILEKCLKDRLISFLKSKNILSKIQFGFTEWSSGKALEVFQSYLQNRDQFLKFNNTFSIPQKKLNKCTAMNYSWSDSFRHIHKFITEY